MAAPALATRRRAPRRRALRLGLIPPPLIALAALAPAAAALAALGLIPTVIAWIADTGRPRHLAASVGWLNGAGTAVAVGYLLSTGDPAAGLPRLLGEPVLWIGIYGAAAIGYGFYLSVPPMLQAWAAGERRERLAAIEKRRREIAEDWGREALSEAEREPV